MDRGTRYKTKTSRKIYKVVGKWEGTIILAPEDENDDQVLLYEPSEMEDEIKNGYFTKLENKGLRG